MSFRMIMILFTVFLALISNTVLAASFDCTKASPGLEKEICTNSELSKADEDLANYYFKLKNSIDAKSAKELLHDQRKWLKQRRTLCAAGDLACLKKLYNDRIHVLRTRYENLVPFEFSSSGEFQGLRGTCGFAGVKFPDEYVIYAAGWYAGRKLDVQIDQSGHEATRFDIIVNSPGKPVVLILGAYEPSIWSVGWTKETVIIAVIATGNHRQAVAGLPMETPILISTQDNGGLCGFRYLNGKNEKEINDFSNKLFNKPTDAIYLVGGGKAVLGSPLKPGEQLLTSADVTVDRLIDKKAPLAGPAGLKDAVKNGILRMANIRDREAWIINKMENVPKDSTSKKPDPFRAGIQPLITDDAYVILKPFRLPKGLYGGNSAVFFLPKGIPFPEGDLGHSTLYDFNTMKCHGPICSQPQ